MTRVNLLNCDKTTLKLALSLISMDAVFLVQNKDEFYPFINCNDMFGGGSDAQEVYLEDLSLYESVINSFPLYGEMAFVSYKRSMLPWKKKHRDSVGFLNAFAYICDSQHFVYKVQ